MDIYNYDFYDVARNRGDGVELAQDIRCYMSMFDDIPHTLQGCILFKAYAEKKIKSNNLENKRLDKIIAECERRIEVKEKENKNG
jgi:hypothetical protein